MKRFGFTGTQRGMTLDQGRVVLALLREEQPTEFHHGDCIGADAQAHKIAVACKVPLIVLHPPINGSKRAWCNVEGSPEITLKWRPEQDYLQRNWNIACLCESLIATPAGREEELRSGTWATVRYARKFKHHIYLVLPDGTVREEA